jgi:transcriptional regulator with XRE-family HTH domain
MTPEEELTKLITNKKISLAEKICLYILYNLHCNIEQLPGITESSLAEVFNTPREKLCRRFEKANKKTIETYLLEQKLFYVSAKIANRECNAITLPGLSLQLGFSSYREFVSLFTGLLRIEPQRYIELTEEKMNPKKGVGERLRILRKHLRYNQEQMGAFLEIGRVGLSSIERGKICPTVYVLYLLRKEFNVSLYWLLYNEGEMIYTETERYGEFKGLCPLNEELKDLLFTMENISMVKHAVLSFFFEYTGNNRELIDQSMQVSDGSFCLKNGEVTEENHLTF